MIEWANPSAALLLVLVLSLPWQPRLTGVLRLQVASTDSLDSPRTLRSTLSWLPRVLQMLGLALVIFAFARPRQTHRSVLVESDGLDIMLAIDTSGSMRATDFTWNGSASSRIDVAKAVMADFVEDRPFDRIGVVVFGEEAFTHVPLTLDHETLVQVLDAVQIGVAGEGQTAIGTAIAVGARRLKDLEAPSRIMILLTDGESNAGVLEPLEAARLAAAVDVKVYTIGIGHTAGTGRLADIRAARSGRNTLTAIAEATGAQHFQARDTRTLESVYDTIDELEPSPAEVEELVHHEEHYRRFLAPGLLLLVASLLARITWWRRFP
jgi:Ca-activated chloride channel family protein